jgi:hypothetical protein
MRQRGAAWHLRAFAHRDPVTARKRWVAKDSLGQINAHRVQIRIDVISGRDVCRLDVPANSRPIWTAE